MASVPGSRGNCPPVDTSVALSHPGSRGADSNAAERMYVAARSNRGSATGRACADPQAIATAANAAVRPMSRSMRPSSVYFCAGNLDLSRPALHGPAHEGGKFPVAAADGIGSEGLELRLDLGRAHGLRQRVAD